MKLQYKNNQWEVVQMPIFNYPKSNYCIKDISKCKSTVCGCLAEYASLECKARANGIPIAPNDQEKVKRLIYNIIAPGKSEEHYKSWEPIEGKLYDSGDLEFELRTVMSEGWVPSYNDPDNFNCYPNAEPTDYWFLKEKAKEKFTLKKCEDGIIRIYNSEGHVHVMWPYHAEVHALEHLAQLNNDTIKQLQSRIAELEREVESLKFWNNEKQLEELGNENSFAVAEAEQELEKKLRAEFEDSTKDQRLYIAELELALITRDGNLTNKLLMRKLNEANDKLKELDGIDKAKTISSPQTPPPSQS